MNGLKVDYVVNTVMSEKDRVRKVRKVGDGEWIKVSVKV